MWIHARLKTAMRSAAAGCAMSAADALRHTKSGDDPFDRHQKDMNREQYDRSKIETGILRACHKRPVSAEKINEMVNKVETELFNGEEREIPSSVIGEKVMHYLKDLDQVAYVRFASIYREFKDVNTFMDELKKMLDK